MCFLHANKDFHVHKVSEETVQIQGIWVLVKQSKSYEIWNLCNNILALMYDILQQKDNLTVIHKKYSCFQYPAVQYAAVPQLSATSKIDKKKSIVGPYLASSNRFIHSFMQTIGILFTMLQISNKGQSRDPKLRITIQILSVTWHTARD